MNIHFAPGQVGAFASDHAAILVQCWVDNYRDNVFFQIDTGSPHSFIFDGVFPSLRAPGRHCIGEGLCLDFGLMSGMGAPPYSRETMNCVGLLGLDFISMGPCTFDFSRMQLRNEYIIGKLAGSLTRNDAGHLVIDEYDVAQGSCPIIYDSGASAFSLVLPYSGETAQWHDLPGPSGKAIKLGRIAAPLTVRLGGCEISMSEYWVEKDVEYATLGNALLLGGHIALDCHAGVWSAEIGSGDPQDHAPERFAPDDF